jgi:hypothetical protein
MMPRRNVDGVQSRFHFRTGGERDLRGVAEVGRLQVRRHRMLVDPPLRHREAAQRHLVAGRVDGRLVDQLVDLLRLVDADLRVGRVEVAHVDAHALLRLGAGDRHPQPHRVVAAEVDAVGRLAEFHPQLAKRPFVAGTQVAVHAERAVIVRDGGHAHAAFVGTIVQRLGGIRRMGIDHHRRVHAELVPQQRNAGERKQDDQQSTENASVHGGSGDGNGIGQTEIGRRSGNPRPCIGSLHGPRQRLAVRALEIVGKRVFVGASQHVPRGKSIGGRSGPLNGAVAAPAVRGWRPHRSKRRSASRDARPRSPAACSRPRPRP